MNNQAEKQKSQIEKMMMFMMMMIMVKAVEKVYCKKQAKIDEIVCFVF